MNRFALVLTLLLLAALAAGCAPPTSMVATLTMLPGTPTLPRRTHAPTRTPQVTPTLETPQPATEEPLYVPANCPAGEISVAPPEDVSRMVGSSYDPEHLPDAFDLQSVDLLDNGRHRWVWVRWQGRSLYWIDKLVCRNVAGAPHWVIIDALELPRLDPALNEAETNLCYTGKKQLPNAVAYGIYDPAEPVETLPGRYRGRLLEVHAAWQVTAQAFTPLDGPSLNCYVEEAQD